MPITPPPTPSEQILKLEKRIKALEEELEISKLTERAALELANEVNEKLKERISHSNKLQVRNEELENPDGRYYQGLSWLGKVMYIIRREGRPLRSMEIFNELNQMDKELSKRSNPSGFLSVVLNKAVKEGRLTIHKLPGTRGSFYAVKEMIDKDGNLLDDMSEQLL